LVSSRSSLLAALALALAAAPLARAAAPPAPRPAMMIKAVPTQKKLIAFTFDDGPNRRYTPQVLDLLRRYHAKATFFLIGQEVVRFPDVVGQIQKAGMEIGNHGMHHKWLHKLSGDAIGEEIQGGADAITAAGGRRPYLYRLPGGYSSSEASQVLGRLGYTIVGWSVDTRDWRMRATADSVERIVLRDAQPGRIVIMHDGSIHREGTIAALGKVLPELERQGYKIVSVGDLLRSSDYAQLRSLVPQPKPKPAKAHQARKAPPRQGWLERLLPRVS